MKAYILMCRINDESVSFVTKRKRDNPPFSNREYAYDYFTYGIGLPDTVLMFWTVDRAVEEMEYIPHRIAKTCRVVAVDICDKDICVTAGKRALAKANRSHGKRSKK